MTCTMQTVLDHVLALSTLFSLLLSLLDTALTLYIFIEHTLPLTGMCLLSLLPGTFFFQVAVWPI